MRRSAFILLLLGLMAPLPVRGGVQGTAHDITLGGQGVCSSCHLPHKALGEKLWPTDMSGQNVYGNIGALCYYCHGPGDAGGSGVVSSNLSNVWDPRSHGRMAGWNPDGETSNDASLPYVMNLSIDGKFECTTCHNVHDDSYKPFLWDNMDRLCLRCHVNRSFVNGESSKEVGVWGNYYGFSNPGSHPIGLDVYQDTAGNNPISPTFGSLVLLFWNSGVPGTHNLGPHLLGGQSVVPTSGSGVGCNTCHAVHGTFPEGGVETPPNDDLLAVAQGVAETGTNSNQRHANGEGSTGNALCESCHRGPSPEGYAGQAYPNPGATINTHPADDYDAMRSLGVSAFPPGWPKGINQTQNAQPNPICGSCHLAHPLAAVTAQADLSIPKVTTRTQLLRDRYPALCFDCHTPESFGKHHPTGEGLMTARFLDATIGNQDANLTCDDCHPSHGAHNWPYRAMPGLDPRWLPKSPSLGPAQASDNGRLLEQGGANRYVPDKSRECFVCHTVSGAHFSPTAARPSGRHANPEYQIMGEGSHYLGQVKLDLSRGSYPRGVPFNAAKDRWAGGGYSMFAGTGAPGAIVCESCHELEMSKNISGSALLLENFRDGNAFDPSLLCEGCHGKAVGSGATHPMTGDRVTKAADIPRENIYLQTTGGAWEITSNPQGTFAGVPDAPTGKATYPAPNAMNCDSCHQVHDAAASTMCLEGDPAKMVQLSAPAVITLYDAFLVQDSSGMDYNYASLCGECHTN